ncbi:MAG: polymerase subunit alpha, Gram-positive type [Acidobacteriota bacterium]|nr:polymerase subunit alpha, Gram-positive type [Acidobacteriota bacterium]
MLSNSERIFSAAHQARARVLQCRAMSLPPNLVSDSPFVEETLLMLRACGGRARVERVAEHVLQVPCDDVTVAALLVSDLLRDDGRFRLSDELELLLDCEDDGALALDATDYVVFDIETTGSKTPPCRIMEIGAYRVSGGRIVAEFESLVNPLSPIPSFISMLTGIDDEMVAHAPLFDEIVHELLDFIGSSVLIAHNAAFDVRFLNHEIARLYPGRKMRNPALCTVSLAKRVVPELANHRLHTVADHFNVSIRGRHRAPGDARATAEVFIQLLSILCEHNVRDLRSARTFRVASAGNASQRERRVQA